MNEEERSNLYIYTYSDLDDDFVFAETKYTLGYLHKLQQENQLLQELMSNNKRLSKVAEDRYDKILELEQELQKYKSLYQNEKEHTDTLKRIIKKIEEYCNSIIKGCDVKDDDGNYLYFYPPYMDDILDLLKEIK